MAKTVFGSGMFTGLDTGTAPHLIGDDKLTESVGGWTEQRGAWRTARGPARLYSGYSDISCFKAGRMNNADHLVWMDGNTLYDNGSSAGTITAGSTMRIEALADKFLILGAAKPYLYDGNHVRELGCWQPEKINFSLKTDTPANTGTFTDVTSANPCQITMATHGLDTGDWIYIDSIVGMTELNGRKFEVTFVDVNTFTINEDTTDYTAYVSNGIYNRKCGLAGDYKFYLTTFIELADGSVIESRPRGLQFDNTDENSNSWDAEVVTLSDTDGIYIDQQTNYSLVYWINDSENLYDISGTRGTDFFPGIRIYRTKLNGTDFYLEREWKHGDNDFDYLAGATAAVYYPDHNGGNPAVGGVVGGYLGGPLDIELGAVYTPSLTAHDNPPAATLGSMVGQRLVVNDPDNPRNLHWAGLDGIEYFDTNGYTPMGDAITAIEPLHDAAVVFAGDRMWEVTFPGGVPAIREIPTPVGTIYPDAICTTDEGVLFLRGDGLWLYNGVRVSQVSRRAFLTIDAPAACASTGTVLYLSGSSGSYIAQLTDGAWEWHQGREAYPYASGTGEYIYAASETAIYKMHAGARSGGKMSTKAFTDGREATSFRVWLDIEGPNIPVVWINGNRQVQVQPNQVGPAETNTGRRLVEVSVPQLSNHLFTMQIESPGDTTVYQAYLEVER